MNVPEEFGPDRPKSSLASNLKSAFTGADLPVIRTARRPHKNTPSWAASDQALKLRIFGPALRRHRIAYLYWRLGWSAREVAEELAVSVRSVKRVIERLKTHDAGAVHGLDERGGKPTRQPRPA